MKNNGERVHRVLNLGAGVQSTTIYLMYARNEIDPGIDCAIFADTGDEPESVYAHLEWMKGLGGPPIITVSVGSRIGDDLVTGRNSKGQRFASIPAFTAVADGAPNVGKVRRQCTREYKIEPIERHLRYEVLGLRPYQKMPRNVLVHQVYGQVAVAIWARRHALVSYADPRQVIIAGEVAQSFVLDNGAFSVWQTGGEAPRTSDASACAREVSAARERR